MLPPNTSPDQFSTLRAFFAQEGITTVEQALGTAKTVFEEKLVAPPKAPGGRNKGATAAFDPNVYADKKTVDIRPWEVNMFMAR